MTYLLGHDATEQDRLFHQHVLWRGTLLPTLQEVGVRRGAAVLEVGCGTGVLLADIAELVLPDGSRHAVFGQGGGDALAEEIGAPLVARIPLEPAVSEGGDAGAPLVLSTPDSPAGRAFVALADRIEADGIALTHVDLGGGLGIRYRDEEAIDPYEYALAVRRARGTRTHRLLFEPGRFLVGNAGVLLTRVQYVKRGADRNFLVVDAAMNDLIRPALYGAWHEVLPVQRRDESAEPAVYDVVGPVCESADFLAKDRALAARAGRGELLVVLARGENLASADPAPPRTRVSGGHVVGKKVFVPFGAQADALLVETAEGLALAERPTTGWRATAQPTLDHAQRFAALELDHDAELVADADS